MTSHNHHNQHDRHPHPVRIIVGNPMAEHRAHEARLITSALTAVCTLAAGCAIVPALNDLVTALVLTAVVALIGAGVVRWAARRVRWWLEDRADTRTAAAWQAQHGHNTNQDVLAPIRAGVA